MYIQPTMKQRIVLTSLAVKGPDNIQQIQLREGLNYPTTHRAIKTFEKHGLVWLASKEQGKKSPQVCNLTPLGVVASILFCGLKPRIDEVLFHWNKVTPRFIANWLNYEENGLQEEMHDLSYQVYVNTAKYYSGVKFEKGQENLLTIRKNSLDLSFLFTLVNQDLMILRGGYNVIVEDPYYHEAWKHWFSLYKFKRILLDRVDKRIQGE